MERWAHPLGALLTTVLVRGLILFATAYAVTSLARRLSSEARHLVWLQLESAASYRPAAPGGRLAHRPAAFAHYPRAGPHPPRRGR